MSSPLEEEASRIAADSRMPVSREWISRREESLQGHLRSIENVARGVLRLGAVILEGRISTDLWVKHRSELLNEDTTQPYHCAMNVMSTTPVSPDYGRLASYARHGKLGVYDSVWHPNVAFQASIRLEDKLVDPKNVRIPIGNLTLWAAFRSWGKLTPEQDEKIRSIPGAYTEFCDLGWDRFGTHVRIKREKGEELTREEAEVVIATMAQHILDQRAYFGHSPLRPDFSPLAGNFTTGPTSSGRSQEPRRELRDMLGLPQATE